MPNKLFIIETFLFAHHPVDEIVKRSFDKDGGQTGPQFTLKQLSQKLLMKRIIGITNAFPSKTK